MLDWTTALPSPPVFTSVQAEKSPDSKPSVKSVFELACTTAVAADIVVPDPAELLAVTATMIVLPTSAGPSV